MKEGIMKFTSGSYDDSYQTEVNIEFEKDLGKLD